MKFLSSLCLAAALLAGCGFDAADYCKDRGQLGATIAGASLAGIAFNLALCSTTERQVPPPPAPRIASPPDPQPVEDMTAHEQPDMASIPDMSQQLPDLASYTCPSGNDNECPASMYCLWKVCNQGPACQTDATCPNIQVGGGGGAPGEYRVGVCGAGGFCRPGGPLDLQPPTCTIDDPFAAAPSVPGLPVGSCPEPVMGADCKWACPPGKSPGRIFPLFARRLPSDDILNWTTIAYGLNFEPMHDIGTIYTGGICDGGWRANRFVKIVPLNPQPTVDTWAANPDLGGGQGINCPIYRAAYIWQPRQFVYQPG